MNAIDLLKTDHEEVKALFDQYKTLIDNDDSSEDRKSIAQEICQMLTVHATVEEEIFYPAARDVVDDSHLMNEAEVEHASANDLIEQIESTSPEDEMFDAKVTVLGEYIDHHVQEEENEIFPACEQSDMDLEALGEQMQLRKAELMEESNEVA